MTDVISRSAVLGSIYEMDISDCTDVEDIIDKVYAMVADAPALDVAPVVHARWTEGGECTRCGCTAEYTEYATECYDYDWDENLVPCGIEYHRIYHTTDYCPTCGARMDGEAHG